MIVFCLAGVSRSLGQNFIVFSIESIQKREITAKIVLNKMAHYVLIIDFISFCLLCNK